MLVSYKGFSLFSGHSISGHLHPGSRASPYTCFVDDRQQTILPCSRFSQTVPNAVRGQFAARARPIAGGWACCVRKSFQQLLFAIKHEVFYAVQQLNWAGLHETVKRLLQGRPKPKGSRRGSRFFFNPPFRACLGTLLNRYKVLLCNMYD